MSESDMPASLVQAILTEPLWLQAWVMLMALTHLAAIGFVLARERGAWHVRIEPIAILASFFVAAAIMEWLFERHGYVRLLGLAHLIGWTPAYAWVLMQRRRIGLAGIYGKYIHVYLLIAGASLVIDVVDVARHLLGDGELYLRWS